MASYKVEWVRPTTYIDDAGQVKTGHQVRIVIYPWNEVRDINVERDEPDLIKEAAHEAIVRRFAMDKLSEVEIELEED